MKFFRFDISAIVLGMPLIACAEQRILRPLSGGGPPVLSGSPATPHPLLGEAIPQHPMLAATKILDG